MAWQQEGLESVNCNVLTSNLISCFAKIERDEGLQRGTACLSKEVLSGG